MAKRKRFTFRSGIKGVKYLRVSSPGQMQTEYDGEGMSLPAQRRKCEEKAARDGLELVAEFLDPGVTATSTEKRKRYQDMVEQLKNDPDIAFVMVYSTSRSHRFWPDAGIFLNTLLELGVRFYSACEDIDITTAAGRMQLGLHAVVDGYQSEKNSEDLIYKMAQKAIIGGTPGWIPMGYLNVSEQVEGHKVNTIALDPERSAFIPLAFEWFATGRYTFQELVVCFVND